MNIYIYLIGILFFSNGYAQNNLIAPQWHDKVEKCLSIIEANDPEVYQYMKSVYIQAGQISGSNEMSAWGFATVEPIYHSNGKSTDISWIMLDSKGLSILSVNTLAGIVLHEAIHLHLWDRSMDGKYIYIKSDEDMDKEHAFIYQYQLDFLKKIHASQTELSFCMNIMRHLGLKVESK